MESNLYATVNRQTSIQSDTTTSSASGKSDIIVRTHKSGLINPPESKILEYHRTSSSSSGNDVVASVYGPIPYS